LSVEEEGRGERQADGRSAAGAVGRAAGVGRHRVDDTHARRRAGRVRNRQRRAEQTPHARAAALGVRPSDIGRRGGGEVERRPGARSHLGERLAHIGHSVRQRHAVAATARVEPAAGEIQQSIAGAAQQLTAVPAPDAGREAQLARLRAEAAAAWEGRGGGGRRRGGRGGRCDGRRRRGGCDGRRRRGGRDGRRRRGGRDGRRRRGGRDGRRRRGGRDGRRRRGGRGGRRRGGGRDGRRPGGGRAGS